MEFYYYKFSINYIGEFNVNISIEFLMLYEWNDESGAKHQLTIIEKVSSEWRPLATLVGLASQIDNIHSKSFMDNKECCRRVFTDWIDNQGTPDYPVTPSGLYKLLVNIRHKAIADNMKRAVSTKRF